MNHFLLLRNFSNMKMDLTKYYFALLLGLLLSFGCKKEPVEFTISGTLVDNSFDTRLSGADIKITAVSSGTGDTRVVGNQTVGTDGMYKITFKRERDTKFYITIEKDGYYPIEETIFFSELSVSEDNVYDYSTFAESNINFKIKNIGTSTTNDELKLEIYEAKTNCDNCCSLGQRYFYGENIDTSFICANNGNKYYKFIYWDTQMGAVTFDSIITPAFGTVDYIIEY